MQFDWVKFQRSLKTLQFQRSYFKIRKVRGGIACEIGCRLRNVGSDHWMRVLRDGGARLRYPWAAAGPGWASGQRAQPHVSTSVCFPRLDNGSRVGVQDDPDLRTL